MAQSLFTPINVDKISLSECRRIVLFHYDKDTKLIEFRHYEITTRQRNINKAVKKGFLKIICIRLKN
jgi:ribosome biogenesis protein SSF1/2